MASPRDTSHQGPGYSGVRYVEPPSGSRSATAERRRSSAGAGPSVPPTFTLTTSETNDYSSEPSRPPNPLMPREDLPVYSPRPRSYSGKPFMAGINPEDLIDRLQPSPVGSRGSSRSRRSSSSAGMEQQFQLMHLGTSSPSRDKLSVQTHAPGYDRYAYEALSPASPVSGASSPRRRTPSARLSPRLGPQPPHEARASRSTSRPGSRGRMRTPSRDHHMPRSARSKSKRRNPITAVESEPATASISQVRKLATAAVHDLNDHNIKDSIQLEDRYLELIATLEEGLDQTESDTELNQWFIDNITRADNRSKALRSVEWRELKDEDVRKALDDWGDLLKCISIRNDTAPVTLGTYSPASAQNTQTFSAPNSRRPSFTTRRPSRTSSRPVSPIDTSSQAVEPRLHGRKPYIETMPRQR